MRRGSSMSSKEDKKAEKIRQKKLKEEEKARKKAEKERIAAEKKALKKARKSGASTDFDGSSRQSSVGDISALSTPATTKTPEAVPEEEREPALPETDPDPDPEPNPQTESDPEPVPEPAGELEPRARKTNPIPDDGVGILAHAWTAGNQVDSGLQPTTHLTWDDFDDDHNVHIGEGRFGMIYEGMVERSKITSTRDGGDSEKLSVVVKKLAANASDAMQSAFVQEAAVLESIDHDCVMRCLGSVTETKPMLIVLEYHGNGDLKSYLGSSRYAGLGHDSMVSFGLSIARGLSFLHGKSVVHKDIATRNCLASLDSPPAIRIGDYGLGRVKFPNDYSMLANLCDGTLPVRWMAPESLATLDFSPSTDLWSFGVTLWEILSLGNQPYGTLSSSEVPDHVGGNNVLKMKPEWPDSLRNLSLSLMNSEPEARTSLSEAIEMLTKALADLNTSSKSDSEAVTSSEPALPESDNKFAKLATSRKSFRSLGTFKEAENPAESMEAAGITDSLATELDHKNLAIEQELGQGAFGVVVKGKLTKDDGTVVPCACKTLKDTKNEESLDALVAEAELVAGFDHPNVVACYGQITRSTPAMIVFEFMANGSLFSYLQDMPELPRLQRLMKMVIDTGKGMAHLEEKNFIHRDLATRNILVAEDLSCKISDFGLSRDLDDDTYYESEGGMVPIRWTPPEAYKYKKYSTASDVWSYGITMYEIWTKGAIPYGKKWTNMNVMLNVEKGYRLPPPEGCPKPVYQLMVQCWNPRRKMRPTFMSITERLQMSYDMLFPDEVDDPDEVSIEDQDYGDLEQIYVGVDVPTEENLDEVENYVMDPTPVNAVSESAKKLASEIESTKSPKIYVGRDVALKPDRFSKDVFSLLGNSKPESKGENQFPSPQMLKKNISPISASPKPDRFANVGKAEVRKELKVAGPAGQSAEFSTLDRKSLRKQRDNTAQDDDAKDDVAYSVADVLKLSQLKEEQSAVEQTGVAKIAAMGIPNVKNNTYVENVGRAVDVKPLASGMANGRKRCVCRRFKCVCGFR